MAVSAVAVPRAKVRRAHTKLAAVTDANYACPQRPATGFAGAATMVSLYAAYASFQGRLDGGGPNWASLWGFHSIARDYTDILLCLLATFAVMVIFEKALSVVRWLALAAVAGSGAAIASAPVLLWSFGGELFSEPEVVLALLLVLLWGLLGVDLALRARRGLAHPLPDRREVSWRQAARSGFYRWLALWSVLTAALAIYEMSRMYSGPQFGAESYYLNWRITAVAIWAGFSLLGLPYCILTVKRRSCLHEDRSDPGLILLLLAHQASRGGVTRIRQLVSRRRVRVVLLDLLVKFFWAPLMVTFLFSECGAFHDGMRGSLPVFGKAGLSGGLSALWGAFFGVGNESFLESTYHMLYHLLFTVDCSLGLLGYVTSSRWLGTKSKSVETTIAGWGVALLCYPPFNSATGQALPYDVNPAGHPYWIFSTLAVHHALMLATILLFTVYVWATVVFGLRFSNLTHRGVLNTGPYHYLRHPAYATKNLAWWAESLGNFGSPWQFVYLAGLNAIYVARALTEERHLMQFEDYRAYARDVRWRFIPGVL